MRTVAQPSLLRRLFVMTTAVLAMAMGLSDPAFARVAVEPYPSYQPQVTCDPTAKPGTTAFRALMFRRFGTRSDAGISRSCESGGTSEHKEGRAWDWGLNYHSRADRRTAKEALTWLTEPVAGDPARRARRLGVMYIIWNERIWSAYSAEQGWRPYDGWSPHRDHVHFSFTWNGAMKRVSWWTGRIMPYDYGPCPRWIGEYAPRWRQPRLDPCPVPIHRPVANKRGLYTVQTGDTIAKVARYFHISREQVRLWNELGPGRVLLYPGDKVRVVALTAP